MAHGTTVTECNDAVKTANQVSTIVLNDVRRLKKHQCIHYDHGSFLSKNDIISLVENNDFQRYLLNSGDPDNNDYFIFQSALDEIYTEYIDR